MKTCNISAARSCKNTASGLLSIIVFLVAAQVFRIAFSQLFFLSAEHNEITDMAFRYIFRIVFALSFIHLAGRKGLLPNHFGAGYIIATAVFAAIMVFTPFVNGERTLPAFFMLVYSAVVTPLYEEVIFRGFVWNRLEELLKNKWAVFAADSILFGLWHIGYADTVIWKLTAASSEGNILIIMLWKVAVGIGYGAVLGLIRMKTKNAYACGLLHGIMNILAP